MSTFKLTPTAIDVGHFAQFCYLLCQINPETEGLVSAEQQDRIEQLGQRFEETLEAAGGAVYERRISFGSSRITRYEYSFVGNPDEELVVEGVEAGEIDAVIGVLAQVAQTSRHDTPFSTSLHNVLWLILELDRAYDYRY